MRTDNDGVAPEDSCRGIRDRRRKGNGVAREKLGGIAAGKGIPPADMRNLSLLAKKNTDTAFCIGKVAAARYFIKHVLPEIDAAVKAVKSEDLSMIDIPEESFAV